MKRMSDRTNTDRTQPAESAKPIKVAVFSSDLPGCACTLYRVIYPLQYLQTEISMHWAVRTEGRRLRIDPEAIDSTDLIVVQRLFPCNLTAPIVEKIMTSGKPVIYETDDLVTDIPLDNPFHGYLKDNRHFLLDFISRVNAVTVSTAPLAEAFSGYSKNIYVLPNLINEALWPKRLRPKDNNAIVIGFTGTPTHHKDLAFIENALIRIAEKHGSRVSFVFMGCVTDRLRWLPGFRYVDFKPTYEEYTRLLPSLGIDIAVAPLLDFSFNRCKSNVKWLEYSLCGIPGVYSDLPPYQASIRHGQTGMLAAEDTDAWFESLDYLIGNTEARVGMAEEARAEVLKNYTLGVGAKNYLRVFRQELTASGHRR